MCNVTFNFSTLLWKSVMLNYYIKLQLVGSNYFDADRITEE